MKLRLALFLSLTACLAFAVSPAMAGKVTPSISLNQVTSGDGLAAESGPSLGSWVTFTTVVPTSAINPRNRARRNFMSSLLCGSKAASGGEDSVCGPLCSVAFSLSPVDRRAVRSG